MDHLILMILSISGFKMKNLFKGLLKGIRVIISVALFTAMCFGIYIYCDRAFNNLEMNTSTNFKNFPDNSIDVLILGTSQAQYSFDPAIFYGNTGLYAYNASSSCQPLEVTYEMLKEVLKTQKPKLLILETFAATPQVEGCKDDGCYIIPLRAFSGQEKYNVINYLPEEKAQDYRYPLVNNHNDWKTKENFDFILPNNVLKPEQIRNETGYLYVDGIEAYPVNWWHASLYPNDVEVELKESDLDNLNKIYDLCQENDIQLFLYKIQIDGIDEVNQSYRHKVWEWAKEKNVPYKDFVDDSYRSGFYINIHTSSFHPYISGAALITTDLYEIIKNFDIEYDHHSFPILEKIYGDAAIDDFALMTRFEFQPRHYLRTLSNGFRGTIYLKHNANQETGSYDLYPYLDKLGLFGINRETNYYAIIHDGEVIAADHNQINMEYDGHKIVINNGGIVIDGQNMDHKDAKLSFVIEANKHEEDQEEVFVVKNIDLNTCMDFYYPDYERDGH